MEHIIYILMNYVNIYKINFNNNSYVLEISPFGNIICNFFFVFRAYLTVLHVPDLIVSFLLLGNAINISVESTIKLFLSK
jgi:hypothetical protein